MSPCKESPKSPVEIPRKFLQLPLIAFHNSYGLINCYCLHFFFLFYRGCEGLHPFVQNSHESSLPTYGGRPEAEHPLCRCKCEPEGDRSLWKEHKQMSGQGAHHDWRNRPSKELSGTESGRSVSLSHQ